MIEQERRDRELALRLTQDPDALDAEAQQGPQLSLQRCDSNLGLCDGILSSCYLQIKGNI